MKGINLTIGEDLLQRVDAARGPVPRVRFLRDLIEQGLDSPTVPPEPLPDPGRAVIARPVTRTVVKQTVPFTRGIKQAQEAASKPFDKNCSKAGFHFEGKLCRWCGGDH